jgi:putative transcriptional regulator
MKTIENLRSKTPTSLEGQFLIAMPGMEDSNFARSVIYLCAHSEDGAMGIVINKAAANTSFRELLTQLDVVKDDGIRLPSPAEEIRVLKGGPVEKARGFVLHSSDYFLSSSTLAINEDVSLTATLEILKAIADGRGPERALLALGYAGWGAGQLETEIQANGWLNCAATQEILFETEIELRYMQALGVLGIDPGLLSAEAGHA